MSPSKGSCLCGGVAFEMTGTPVRVNHWHCSRCRKARGTSHATNLLVWLPGLHFVRGEDLPVEQAAAGAGIVAAPPGTAAAMIAELGPGQRLDGAVAQRMAEGFDL